MSKLFQADPHKSHPGRHKQQAEPRSAGSAVRQSKRRGAQRRVMRDSLYAVKGGAGPAGIAPPLFPSPVGEGSFLGVGIKFSIEGLPLKRAPHAKWRATLGATSRGGINPPPHVNGGVNPACAGRPPLCARFCLTNRWSCAKKRHYGGRA